MIVTKFLRRVQKAGVVKQQARNIYVKDKDLDKANYKTSELEYLEQYVKLYMKDDPAVLSDEDQAKLYEQARTLAEQSKSKYADTLLQPTIANNSVKDLEQVEAIAKDDSKVIDPSVVKQIFQKWTEIDQNPQSEEAEDFYQKFETAERQNPHKKPAHIIFKTFKKHRSPTAEESSKEDLGLRATEEEEEYLKKYIDYKALQFPEVNPIDIKIKLSQNEYKLANYRYPSIHKEKKGIIYFVHGFGDYCQKYAYFAKDFADNGYDFVGMDQIGFGHSEGPRGLFESEEAMLDQHLTYFDKVRGRYGGKEVPEFLLGHSLGGILSAKLSVVSSNKFNGMGLLTPYVNMLNDNAMTKYMSMAKLAAKVLPNIRLGVPQPKISKAKRHIQEVMDDPLLEFKKIAARNLIINETMLKKFNEEQVAKITTPLIMILGGGQEQTVSNKAAEEFFGKVPLTDKDIITYDDLDHFIIHDREYLPLITKDLVGWFNTHI